MNLGAELSLDSLVKSITRHAVLFVLVVVLGMAATVATYVMLEKQYESEARLFVQLGRSSVGLDPTATTSGTISVMDSRETEINSIVDMIGSRGVAEQVVQRVGAEEILASKYDAYPIPQLPSLSGGAPGEQSELAAKYSEGRTFEQQRQYELAVKKFSEDMLAVVSEKKTSVVTIYCKANSPELAKTLADTTLEVAQRMHLNISYVSQSNPFFEEEYANREASLDALETQRVAFLNEHRVLAIDSERSLTQSLIDRLSYQLHDTKSEIVALTEELEKLKSKLGNTVEMLALPKTGLESLPKAAAEQLHTSLSSELASLEKRYKPEHHLVQETRTKLEQVAAELAGRDQSRTESVQQRNPVYESLELRVSEAEARLASKQTLLEYVEGQLAEQVEKQAGLNVAEQALRELDREIEIARSGLYEIADRKQESEILARLNDHQISNLEVASFGSYVTKHIFPKASMMLPLGLVGSLAIATFLSLWLDRKKLSRPSVTEVERHAGAPVLVTLPRVRATVRQ